MPDPERHVLRVVRTIPGESSCLQFPKGLGLFMLPQLETGDLPTDASPRPRLQGATFPPYDAMDGALSNRRLFAPSR
jgi:hypothetical protein